MKKGIVALLISITFLGLVACSKNLINLGDESKYRIDDNLVTMKIKENSLTNSKAIITLTNQTEDDYIYGNPYFIEYNKNNVWYELKPLNECYFTLEASGLEKNESRELKIDWKDCYGELHPGKYRIVKDIYGSTEPSSNQNEKIYISVEFKIK